MSGLDQSSELVLRHSLTQRFPGCFVSLQRHLVSQPHQRDFIGALDHPAAGRDLCRGTDSGRRNGLADTIREHKLYPLLNADVSSGQATLLERERHHLVRAFVFLPSKNVRRFASGAEGNLLESAIFLKRRRNEEGLASHRQDHNEQALAVSPTHTAEILERCAADHGDCVQFVFLHEALGALDACLALLVRDGVRFRSAALELGNCVGRLGRRQVSGGESGAELQDAAAREHGWCLS